MVLQSLKKYKALKLPFNHKTVYAPLILSLVLFSCADKKSRENSFQSLLVTSYEDHPNVKGIMLHVESPKDSISWSGAVGYSNWEQTDTIEVNQPANIASMTKTYVATAILRLVEQGKLSLDQNISELVSAKTDSLFTLYNFEPAKITVAQLMSHKSGIPNYVGTELFNYRLVNEPQYRWTRDEQIELALKHGPLYPPATGFEYTDTNYLLLTEIIEKFTDMPFHKAISELIGFEKLGLSDTWFYTLDDYPKNSKPLIHQYVPRTNEHTYDIDPSCDLYGGGGIVATSKDAAIFFYQLFNDGIFEKKETLSLMLTDVQLEGNASEGGPCNYLLGIEECNIGGYSSYGHTGYWGTVFRYFPELDAAIVFYVVNEAEYGNIELDLMEEITSVLEEN